MNTSQALDFLKEHQPLPPDDKLSHQLLNTFDQVRKYFLDNKDKRCIPLLLGSFGDGSGFGTYQLIEDVIIQFSPQEVIPFLNPLLNSKHRGIRYWCAQIACSFPDPVLIESLSKLLNDKDTDCRIMAAIALGRIDSHETIEILQKALLDEKDEDAREAIEESLADLSESH